MKLEKALAVVIFKHRKEKKLSQEKLAELSNIHRTYISQIERSLKSPTIGTVFSICKALEINTSSLIKEIEDVLSSK